MIAAIENRKGLMVTKSKRTKYKEEKTNDIIIYQQYKVVKTAANRHSPCIKSTIIFF